MAVILRSRILTLTLTLTLTLKGTEKWSNYLHSSLKNKSADVASGVLRSHSVKLRSVV